jgi:hypothetical protein
MGRDTRAGRRREASPPSLPGVGDADDKATSCPKDIGVGRLLRAVVQRGEVNEPADQVSESE